MTNAASKADSQIKDTPVRDLITAIQFTKLLKSKDGVLSYPKINHISKAALIFFNDASFANLKHNGS